MTGGAFSPVHQPTYYFPASPSSVPSQPSNAPSSQPSSSPSELSLLPTASQADSLVPFATADSRIPGLLLLANLSDWVVDRYYPYNNSQPYQIYHNNNISRTVSTLACGAKGGDNEANVGGKGGCIITTVVLNASIQNLYVFPGGRGQLPQPGYNGGGLGHCASEWAGSTQFGGGGGGATDIRTRIDDVFSRIVVAAGGGGCGYDGGMSGLTGGDGGGLTGGDGQNRPRSAAGGTQATGGLGGQYTSWGAPTGLQPNDSMFFVRIFACCLHPPI